MDRRIAKTRGVLEAALNSLTLKVGYEAVTIKDICDEANVGRSTFYAHFTGKDDLKRHGLDHLRQQLVARQGAVLATERPVRDRAFSFSLVMLEHARDHEALYKVLVNDRGGSVALGFIREILGELIRADLAVLQPAARNDRARNDATVQYLTGGFMALLTWWLDGGAKQSPHEIDAMFRRMSLDGIALPVNPDP